MSTDAVNSATNASSATTSSGNSTSLVSKDDFLKILMAQLQHQDPLKPTDPTQFVTELSQLTQVETLQNIQKDMSNLATSLNHANVGQWVSSIGGYMQVDDATVSSGDKVLLSPSASYDTITVSLKNSSGTITEKTLTSDDSLVFDVDGSYTITGVSATKDGKSVSCGGAVYRLITGVQPGTSGSSDTLLMAGDGTAYAISEVITITK
jgi:flagellar basal-body rod modification protein FlgD